MAAQPGLQTSDYSSSAMSEARLSSIEAALMDRPTTDMVRYELDKSLDRQLQTIVAILDARKNDRRTRSISARRSTTSRKSGQGAKTRLTSWNSPIR